MMRTMTLRYARHVREYLGNSLGITERYMLDRYET